jgi:cytochrome c oxidase cbb3-type subunit 3
MSNEKEPLLLDHDADGITELDNNLPRWWVWLFWLCIAWGFAYLLYFHAFRVGDLSAVKYEKEMAAAVKSASALAVIPDAGAESPAEATPAPSTDAAVLVQGQDLFTKNCLVCHTADGGGLIGPNLCDEYWIHGGTFADSVRTIQEGVPAKGMITWKLVLKPDEIMAVASYIYTLRGTTPAAPKAPEGEKVPAG